MSIVRLGLASAAVGVAAPLLTGAIAREHVDDGARTRGDVLRTVSYAEMGVGMLAAGLLIWRVKAGMPQQLRTASTIAVGAGVGGAIATQLAGMRLLSIESWSS